MIQFLYDNCVMFVAVYLRYSDKVEDGQFIFLGKRAEKRRIMLFNCANQIVFKNNNNKNLLLFMGQI